MSWKERHQALKANLRIQSVGPVTFDVVSAKESLECRGKLTIEPEQFDDLRKKLDMASDGDEAMEILDQIGVSFAELVSEED